tara:strand:- start:8037 stop:8198 length:162 start_codon:yes stop_codon:yes gene_type:complete
MHIAFFVFWIQAIIVDAKSDTWGWVVVDVIVFPLGVIRGFLMLIDELLTLNQF